MRQEFGLHVFFCIFFFFFILQTGKCCFLELMMMIGWERGGGGGGGELRGSAFTGEIEGNSVSCSGLVLLSHLTGLPVCCCANTLCEAKSGPLQTQSFLLFPPAATPPLNVQRLLHTAAKCQPPLEIMDSNVIVADMLSNRF